jgi:hypothetical protein
MDEDRILLELDRGVPVLRCCSHYLTLDDELLLVHGSLLTTDHLLFYERHLPWERDLATPWKQGKDDP